MLNGDPRRKLSCDLAFWERMKGVDSGDQEPERDPVSGKFRRLGWDRLLEYFHVAAPGMIPDDNIIYAGYPLPNWCGIFALWAIKSAGMPVGNWRPGHGIASVRGFEPLDRNNGDTPQPGDVGCFIKHGHMDLICCVSGNDVYTIDGNSGPYGGRITGYNFHSINDFNAGIYTAFNTKMFPPTPLGRWEVQIGADNFVYEFHEKGGLRSVGWYDRADRNSSGSGTWDMDDMAVNIVWEASAERWDLPLTANDQRGVWIKDGLVAAFVSAKKLRA